MRLIEAEGKRVLKEMGVVTPDQGGDGSFFVKAQVMRGGRGKAGLVRRAETTADVARVKAEIEHTLGRAPEQGFLVEREVPHVREWFLSIDLDRAAGDWRVNLGEGGVDVASAKSVPLVSFDDGRFAQIVHALSQGMRAHRLQSVEINPLAELEDGSFVALDAKIVTEDEAAVSSVDLDGDIALVLSGGGASLVALDALQLAGGRAANFVELSGNPDPDVIRQTASSVFSKPGLRAVWVAGSFANFTDIASMLSAIRDAYDAAGLSVPFVVRRDGPNADRAQSETLAWAKAKGIRCEFHRAETDLEASAKELMSLI
jgi:succinyl-CoA synthetase beta subunit